MAKKRQGNIQMVSFNLFPFVLSASAQQKNVIDHRLHCTRCDSAIENCGSQKGFTGYKNSTNDCFTPQVLVGLPLYQDMDIQNPTIELVATDSQGLTARNRVMLQITDHTYGHFTHRSVGSIKRLIGCGGGVLKNLKTRDGLKSGGIKEVKEERDLER